MNEERIKLIKEKNRVKTAQRWGFDRPEDLNNYFKERGLEKMVI